MNNGMIPSHGSVDSSKQALVMDLKSAVGDADRLLANVVAASADEIAMARTKLESRLAHAKTMLVDASMAVSDRALFFSRPTPATSTTLRPNAAPAARVATGRRVPTTSRASRPPRAPPPPRPTEPRGIPVPRHARPRPRPHPSTSGAAFAVGWRNSSTRAVSPRRPGSGRPSTPGLGPRGRLPRQERRSRSNLR